MSGRVQSATRRSQRAAATPPQPAAEPSINPFLNTAFEPVCFGLPAEISDQAAVEAGFWVAVNNLCTLYGWNPDLFESDYPYPLNIWQTYSMLAAQLSTVEDDELKLAIVRQDDKSPVTLATYSQWQPDSLKLYYIPLEYYWNLLQQKQNKKRTALIESIMAYLLSVGVPDCTNDSCFVGHSAEYSIVLIEEEWEPEKMPDDLKEVIDELKLENKRSKLCLKRAYHPKALTGLAQRLVRFKPQSDLDKQLYTVGEMVLALSRKYPYRSILDSEHTELVDREEYSEGVISLDQYLSFIWNTEGRTYENIIQDLDACMQSGDIEGNLSCVQFFDTPQSKSIHPNGLDFEKALFDVVDEFKTYLYQLDKTETQHEESDESLCQCTDTPTGSRNL